MFSSATLVLKPNGITRGVKVDGQEIPNVARANIKMDPDQGTLLVVEILIDTVETVVE